MNIIHYLTNAINADISAVLCTERPIPDFTGEGEEEVVTFSEAVQLTHVLIWNNTHTHTHTGISDKVH